MNLPAFPSPDTTAFFLDFDGTLVEIADHPDAVAISPVTRNALSDLSTHCDNALAIITGREIEVIDHFLSPMKLPIAGIHGLSRRDALGNMPDTLSNTKEFIDVIVGSLNPIVEKEPGLLLEVKTASVALHYRARPELESICTEAIEKAIGDMTGVELKRGKMVLEAKPDTANKGTAILDYMNEPPFAGRRPWFAGDDVTDEDAFKVVNSLGGVSIKVGPGDTSARHRADTTAHFLSWLIAGAADLTAEERT